jgi:hypothetical protein
MTPTRPTGGEGTNLQWSWSRGAGSGCTCGFYSLGFSVGNFFGTTLFFGIDITSENRLARKNKEKGNYHLVAIFFGGEPSIG